jgi:hypothetical protein
MTTVINTWQVAKRGRQKRTGGGDEDEQNRDVKSRWLKKVMVTDEDGWS